MAPRKKAPKKVCISIAQAKKLGVASAMKTTKPSFKSLLRTETGKRLREAQKVVDKSRDCNSADVAARAFARRTTAFLEANWPALTKGKAKQLRDKAASVAKRAKKTCSVYARQQTKREAALKRAASLRGRRR